MQMKHCLCVLPSRCSLSSLVWPRVTSPFSGHQKHLLSVSSGWSTCSGHKSVLLPLASDHTHSPCSPFYRIFYSWKKFWKMSCRIWLFFASPRITQPDILNRNQVTLSRWHKAESGERLTDQPRHLWGIRAASSYPCNLLTMPGEWWALQPVIARKIFPSACQYTVQKNVQRWPFPWVRGVALPPYPVWPTW